MTHDHDISTHPLAGRDEFSDADRHELADAFTALDLLDVESDSRLVGDTLFAVRQAIAEERATHPAPSRWRQWTSLAAAAAVVVAMLTLIPAALDGLKTYHLRTACEGNLNLIGQGLSRWAAEHDDTLPHSGEAVRWLAAADAPAASNSRGLYNLIPAGFVKPATFRCAAVDIACPPAEPQPNDFASPCDIHYSYQHMLAGRTERLSQGRAPKAILADRTPLATYAQHYPNRQNNASPNHSTGQNVLYTDGAVKWTTDADCGLNGDNIFSPKSYTGELGGTETPEDKDDTFLLPAWAPVAAK
jgi:hypothetical protein